MSYHSGLNTYNLIWKMYTSYIIFHPDKNPFAFLGWKNDQCSSPLFLLHMSECLDNSGNPNDEYINTREGISVRKCRPWLQFSLFSLFVRKEHMGDFVHQGVGFLYSVSSSIVRSFRAHSKGIALVGAEGVEFRTFHIADLKDFFNDDEHVLILQRWVFMDCHELVYRETLQKLLSTYVKSLVTLPQNRDFDKSEIATLVQSRTYYLAFDAKPMIRDIRDRIGTLLATGSAELHAKENTFEYIDT
ncbi:hypothetical protein BPAE_0038g00360 [Botrytis paeoniae]|uniref:Uncharacterized protein n=1 Tax=Botrytis paeoniae TaxID=278948 RepID=A0A4Z1FWP5_9HELO|nr:hypothetical protein BPAE_0038g00360 [Botrytis paeoniae]